MKGATYSSFNATITISQTLPIPIPDPDGVLVQIQATGVCRSDWHGWKGHDGDIQQYFDSVGPPFIPGHEASGIIVQIGSRIQSLKVGDRVAIPFILSCGTCRECSHPRNQPTVCEDQHQPGFTMCGTFAEYCAISRAERNVRILPENVSFVEAAALGCRFTTAYRAVLQQGQLCQSTAIKGGGNGNNEKTVAIFGCGGLGLSCVAIAAAFGAKRIITVDINIDALEKALDLGATDIVRSKIMPMSYQWNDSNIKDNAVYRQIMEMTDGAGADLTIDAGGFEQTCLDAIWTTRRGGRFVQVGLPSKQVAMPMARVAGREIIIAGSHGFSSVENNSGVSALDHILELVACGKLQPRKLVDREVTLEEGVKALMDMDTVSPLGMVMITKFCGSDTKSKL